MCCDRSKSGPSSYHHVDVTLPAHPSIFHCQIKNRAEYLSREIQRSIWLAFEQFVGLAKYTALLKEEIATQ